MPESFLDSLPSSTDKADTAETAALPKWKILVVDDDEDVHAATDLVLGQQEICGRKLDLLHAFSAREAIQTLSENKDVSVILLDVMMESHTAGLDIISDIRNDLQMTSTRIIIRTGQPGYAPELEVINNYDINDYQSKTDLTSVRLITTVTSALRAYRQIRMIESSKQGLTQIVHGSGDLILLKDLRQFASGVLTQISALLGVDSENGIVLLRNEADANSAIEIVAKGGVNPNESLEDMDLDDNDPVQHIAVKALNTRNTLYENGYGALFVSRPEGTSVAIGFKATLSDDDIQKDLLKVFSSNILSGFENIALFDQTRFLANHDPLTGLLNHNGLLNFLDSDQGKEGDIRTIYAIKIRNYSYIYDGLGLETGLQTINAFVNAIKQKFTEGNFVLARVQTNEFVIVETGPAREHHGQQVLQYLDELCSNALTVGSARVKLNLTGGIAHDEYNIDAQTLLQQAELALRSAPKSSSFKCVTFQEDMEKTSQVKLHISNYLYDALENNEFAVHFHPVVSLQGGEKLLGCEALVRWNSANGSISPAQFIPIAEASGGIIALGKWIFKTALSEYAEMVERNPTLYLSLNLSARQLAEKQAFDELQDIMTSSPLAPRNITIELTETDALSFEDPMIEQRLRHLRKSGYGLSIDDFGTGHSSLARLNPEIFTELKIDQVFVSQIGDADHNTTIINNSIKLAKDLGMKVVAEGIETQKQANYLRHQGCLKGQGFLWDLPMPIHELLTKYGH